MNKFAYGCGIVTAGFAVLAIYSFDGNTIPPIIVGVGSVIVGTITGMTTVMAMKAN